MRQKYNSPPNWPAPPANWTPPKDWRPDPLWGPAPAGWQFWVPASGLSTGSKLGIGAAAVAATLVVGIGIGASSGSGSTAAEVAAPTTSTSASVAPAPKASKTAEPEQAAPVAAEPAEEVAPEAADAVDASYGSMPKQQKDFVAAVTKAQQTDADNDLKLGKALSKRNKKLCSMLSGKRVKNWTGKIVEIDANNDGKGIVSIEIAEDVHISTWNNAFSDLMDNTLIEPGALFDDVLEREEGDIVKFSGTFADGGETCVNDSRITLSGKLQDPDFIFKFRSIKAGE